MKRRHSVNRKGVLRRKWITSRSGSTTASYWWTSSWSVSSPVSSPESIVMLQSLLDSALSCFNNYFLDNILVLQIFDSPTKAKELKAAAPLYFHNSDLDTDLALNVFQVVNAASNFFIYILAGPHFKRSFTRYFFGGTRISLTKQVDVRSVWEKYKWIE